MSAPSAARLRRDEGSAGAAVEEGRQPGPLPHTAPSRAPRVPALAPSRPAHLAPALAAGAGTTMARDLTDARPGCPAGVREESEHRRAATRGWAPATTDTRG